jgi:transcriptional regulator with XRE-family HTH domain
MSKPKNPKEWTSKDRLPEGFSKWLKELVTEQQVRHKKSFTEIANELGVKASRLSRWVAGKGPLDQDDIRALAKSLGPAVYTFLGQKQPNNPDPNRGLGD